MSDPKTPADITARLTEPFPETAVKIHPETRNRYVDSTTVFRRLISATDNNFSVEVVDQQIRDFGVTKRGASRLLLLARVRLTIPGMGSREHVGVQVVNAENGGEDLWKGSISDAIKKAATLFGVGLELYGPDYEAGEIDAPAQRQPQPAPRAPQTPRNAPQAANTAPDASSTRQRVMARLHAVAADAGFTHDHLHALVGAKGFPSLNDAPDEVLIELGKKIVDEPAPLRTWLNQRAADQVSLMPTPDEVPNPDRYTR